MLTCVFVLFIYASELHSTSFPLSDYFVQDLHGAAQNNGHLAVLNFSQMKTKLCIIDLKEEVVRELDDPRLKIFISRKIIPFQDGFLIIRNKLAYHVSANLDLKETIRLDSFQGLPPNMLWVGIQPIQRAMFLCNFIDDEGFHVLTVLDLEQRKFQPLHRFHSEKHHTVYFFNNNGSYFAFHSKFGSLVEHDSSFAVVRRLLPELPPVMRKKNSRLYKRNPYNALIHTVFSDATAVWFDVYPTDSGTGEVMRKRYRLQDGKLHAVSDNLVTLARFEGKALNFDTEEGTMTINVANL
ncbi:hypothetical protein [Acanthopleuribacter pedis]|uniref:Uncharacterized protein n=1 Tax=Acanthopleuribacter pedis TaxID=442870 RepID=A0A8J7Q8M2_9BACT|nr:hypothetical protein [Acanthopleuribacter pedis]MBO1320536.1 hypothetical protein [Acanthopleuribacter pedis]